MKRIISAVLRNFGYEVRRFRREIFHFYPENLAKPQTIYETDTEFNTRYENAQRMTQMGSTDNALRRQRHYTLYHLLRNLHGINGDFCEIGCWRGLSAYQTAEYIKESRSKGRFSILDSFEGLSEFKDEDKIGQSYNFNKMRNVFSCPESIVRHNLKEFDFISYHKGWVPSQFEEVAERFFCWVHIDVDLYQPTQSSIEFFYPRLVHGGIMVFDDYGSSIFPGAKQAVDEFLGSVPAGDVFFLPLTSGQAFLVKNRV